MRGPAAIIPSGRVGVKVAGTDLTEIDRITGALVREAEQYGVPVPLHAAMYRLVKGREASWSSAISVSSRH